LLADGERLSVIAADNVHRGRILAKAVNFGRRGDGGNKNFCWISKLLRRIRHGSAVISTRGGNYAGLRDLRAKNAIEGAARLERSGVLQIFKLEKNPGVHFK